LAPRCLRIVGEHARAVEVGALGDDHDVGPLVAVHVADHRVAGRLLPVVRVADRNREPGQRRAVDPPRVQPPLDPSQRQTCTITLGYDAP
jgi:hypothetical protein